jgi:hypothetical protein
MSPELSTADLSAAAQARREDRHDQTDAPAKQTGTDSNEQPMALFSEQQVSELRSRWDQIQAGFVDEPRGAVEKADGLVADAISRLAEGFARTRAELDHQWNRGDTVSTEDLRQALRRYRSFFTRLLQA